MVESEPTQPESFTAIAQCPICGEIAVHWIEGDSTTMRHTMVAVPFIGELIDNICSVFTGASPSKEVRLSLFDDVVMRTCRSCDCQWLQRRLSLAA